MDYERRDNKLTWIVMGGLAAIGAACLLYPWPADAQAAPPPPCFPFEVLSTQLEATHHEVQLSGGIVHENGAIIVFGTPTGSTWTLVSVVFDSGQACIIATGQGWFQHDLLKGEPV